MALMSRALGKVNVFVDDKPVQVPEETSPYEILTAGGRDPDAYTLVAEDPRGGSDTIPAGNRIIPRDGQRFESNLTATGG